MTQDSHRTGNGILGDIDPAPEPESPDSGEPVRDRADERKPRPTEGSEGGGPDVNPNPDRANA